MFEDYAKGTLTYTIGGVEENTVSGYFTVEYNLYYGRNQVLRWNAQRGVGVLVCNTEDILSLQFQ